MAIPTCCRPHSLIAFLLPPDIQTNTLEFYSLKTLTGVCFPKDNFLVDLGCSINNHQTSTPPVDQALVTQKLCIHYFEPTPPTAPGQPGWPGYLTHYLALVESGPKHFSLAHCGIRWTLALNASGHWWQQLLHFGRHVVMFIKWLIYTYMITHVHRSNIWRWCLLPSVFHPMQCSFTAFLQHESEIYCTKSQLICLSSRGTTFTWFQVVLFCSPISGKFSDVLGKLCLHFLKKSMKE